MVVVQGEQLPNSHLRKLEMVCRQQVVNVERGHGMAQEKVYAVSNAANTCVVGQSLGPDRRLRIA